MFHRKGDKIIGVLTDWDLAEQKSEGDEADYVTECLENLAKGDPSNADALLSHRPGPPLSGGWLPDSIDEGSDTSVGEVERRRKAKYRTGTGPFMVIDLQQADGPPYHLYRHDLGSFWVLTWFCAVFDPTTRTLGIIPSWHQQNLRAVGAAKEGFLKSKAIFDVTFAKTHNDSRCFLNTWIQPLRVLFATAAVQSDRARLYTEQYADAHKSLQSARRSKKMKLAFTEASDALRQLKDLVTYEEVMSELDEPW